MTGGLDGVVKALLHGLLQLDALADDESARVLRGNHSVQQHVGDGDAGDQSHLGGDHGQADGKRARGSGSGLGLSDRRLGALDT